VLLMESIGDSCKSISVLFVTRSDVLCTEFEFFDATHTSNFKTVLHLELLGKFDSFRKGFCCHNLAMAAAGYELFNAIIKTLANFS
jgi:hypothetical protein